MSEAIEKARAQRRAQTFGTFPLECSGRTVTVEIPEALEYLAIAKTLPTPILNKAVELGETQGVEAGGVTLITEADRQETAQFVAMCRALVNITVKEIELEGVMAPVTPEDNISEVIEDDEGWELLAYAQRRKPLPKVAAAVVPAESETVKSEWTPSGPSVNLLSAGSMQFPVNGSASIPQDSSETTSWR